MFSLAEGFSLVRLEFGGGQSINTVTCKIGFVYFRLKNF
jgi:hypothetical protein